MDSITYISHANIIRIHVCDLEILAFFFYCIAVLEKYTGHHCAPYNVIRETADIYGIYDSTCSNRRDYSLFVEHSIVLILLCFVLLTCYGMTCDINVVSRSRC